jgi:hypothetical protein
LTQINGSAAVRQHARAMSGYDWIQILGLATLALSVGVVVCIILFSL